MSTFLLFHPQILWKYRHVHKQLLFTTNLHDTNNNAFTTFIDCVVIYLWLFQRWHIVKRNVSFITPPVALQSETTTDCDIHTYIHIQTVVQRHRLSDASLLLKTEALSTGHLFPFTSSRLFKCQVIITTYANHHHNVTLFRRSSRRNQ